MMINIDCHDGVWTCSGEGPMRPIITEGLSLSEAKDAYQLLYGRQYEEMERHTHHAMNPFEEETWSQVCKRGTLPHKGV